MNVVVSPRTLLPGIYSAGGSALLNQNQGKTFVARFEIFVAEGGQVLVRPFEESI